MNAIFRLPAFILVCIGIQIAWNGTSALLQTILVRRP
jgi:small neutral amino acid transporter SnatA (MarC family)